MSAKLTLIKQAKTKRGLKLLFGPAYDPTRCGRNCTDEGVSATWQCGQPNGKGLHGLYCWRHA